MTVESLSNRARTLIGKFIAVVLEAYAPPFYRHKANDGTESNLPFLNAVGTYQWQVQLSEHREKYTDALNRRTKSLFAYAQEVQEVAEEINTRTTFQSEKDLAVELTEWAASGVRILCDDTPTARAFNQFIDVEVSPDGTLNLQRAIEAKAEANASLVATEFQATKDRIEQWQSTGLRMLTRLKLLGPMNDSTVATVPTPAQGTRRAGRLPRDESEAMRAAMLAKLIKHPSMKDDIPALAREAGVNERTARRWIEEDQKRYEETRAAMPDDGE